MSRLDALPKVKLNVRIFRFSAGVTAQHSFLVANDQGGVTDTLEVLEFERGGTTLKDLRVMVEEVRACVCVCVCVCTCMHACMRACMDGRGEGLRLLLPQAYMRFAVMS